MDRHQQILALADERQALEYMLDDDELEPRDAGGIVQELCAVNQRLAVLCCNA